MSEPVPMLLFCPFCNTRHIDDGDFAKKPHHTHACQNMECGMVWRPAVVPTVGVRWLPGFNNAINKLDAWTDQQAPIDPIAKLLPPFAVDRLYGVYAEFAAERKRQFAQWGGDEHDDEHGRLDWLKFIRKQLGRASGAGHRESLVKIGALAVAAIESFDRKAK